MINRVRTPLIRLVGMLALLSALFVSARPVYAAAISVTTTSDTMDAGAGCAAITIGSLPGPGGQTSLREAICAANSNPGADTITFIVNGLFMLSGAANEDNGTTGDLDIKDGLTINGNGLGLTIIDGGGIERIFDVFPVAAITFDLANLTLQNGDTRLTAFKEGGAIYMHNNVTSNFTNIQIINNFSGANGAIENRGTLTIQSSTISGNQTIPASGSVTGGGIHNSGALTINNSTISNNSVRGEGGGIFTNTANGVITTINASTISGNSATTTGGALGNGGGISTTGNDGLVIIKNSTISGNSADTSGGGLYAVTPGGGTGRFTLTHVTITANTADKDNNAAGSGGGIAQSSASVELYSSIIAGNFNTIPAIPDYSGTLAAASAYNLLGSGSGMSGISHGSGGNLVGTAGSPVNPLLVALADNGGSTRTHALDNGSPALEQIPSGTNGCGTAYTSDQRGLARPGNKNQPINKCEMGAWEAANTDATSVQLLGFVAQPVGRNLAVLGLAALAAAAIFGLGSRKTG